jgi:hypothetical protein
VAACTCGLSPLAVRGEHILLHAEYIHAPRDPRLRVLLQQLEQQAAVHDSLRRDRDLLLPLLLLLLLLLLLRNWEGWLTTQRLLNRRQPSAQRI